MTTMLQSSRTIASADVAELADARDLKSRGLGPCGFESHRRHHSRLEADDRRRLLPGELREL